MIYLFISICPAPEFWTVSRGSPAEPVQAARLPVLHEGGGWDHGITELPEGVPSEKL